MVEDKDLFFNLRKHKLESFHLEQELYEKINNFFRKEAPMYAIGIIEFNDKTLLVDYYRPWIPEKESYDDLIDDKVLEKFCDTFGVILESTVVKYSYYLPLSENEKTESNEVRLVFELLRRK